VRCLLFICIGIIGLFPEASSQEYFQQEVNYTIHVTLNDKLHELSASETIEYINNSPDTLQFLFFHLWPNGYSSNNTGLARQLMGSRGREKLFNDPELRGYIDSLKFKIDDQEVEWNLLPDQPDICRLKLKKEIKHGDTIKITTPFHVKIPKGVTSRLGHIGESYQISQWYPKPAVYDRTGWHQMPYLDQGEFYSEFGSFDVTITLPSNYIVAATGNLQTDAEVEMLDKLAADTAWKRIPYYSTDFPPSSQKMKTLRYTESKIHDFAWFADKRFHVEKGKVKLPDSGRDVSTYVMYTNQQAELWKDALKYLNNAIGYFSKCIGDYPYNTFTAVQSALNAGAGMEYPGITVIGLAEDAYSLDEVIAHEACHSWFYSALGSDERRYPFMDEGITSAYEVRYMSERYPGKKLWEVYFKNIKLAKFFHIDKMPVQRMQELEWLSQARVNLEQPVNFPAPDYTVMNYNVIIYFKAALGFNYLRAYLGNPVFDSIMHEYYQTWRSKHPQPDDLRKIFESHTEKNLKWFFDDFIGTTKRMDYKVVRLRNRQLLVKNNGELEAPLVISGMTGDSIYFEKWIDGFEGQRWIEIPGGNYSEIKIDPNHLTPELFRLNNNIRPLGLFPKADPFQPDLMYTIEDPGKRSLIYTPVVDWNKEDGLMIGAAINNGLFLSKRLDYFAIPLYSIRNPEITGYGRISYNIIPYNSFIRMATITLEGTKFGAPGNEDYHKVKTGADLYFRKMNMNDRVSHKVYGYYIAASDLLKIELFQKTKMNSFLQFGYMMERTTLINPFNLIVFLESNKSFQKSSVEFNYKYSYIGKKNGLDVRFFAGKMIKNNSDIPFYAFSTSGRGGREQYLYQGLYPDRFTVFPKTFWSRQMTISEGGLVSPVNDSLGYSQWLISVSFTSNLPGRVSRIPVKPFVNIVWNDHGSGIVHKSPVFFEAGFKAGIWNIFEIYVPVIVSDNIKSITGSFKDRIRLVLKLDTFNKVKLKSGVVN
jgi:hypothetical protein